MIACSNDTYFYKWYNYVSDDYESERRQLFESWEMFEALESRVSRYGLTVVLVGWKRWKKKKR